jgi:hypothetical protein
MKVQICWLQWAGPDKKEIALTYFSIDLQCHILSASIAFAFQETKKSNVYHEEIY